MDPFSIGGIIIAIGIAVLQNQRRKKEEQKRKTAEAELKATLDQISSDVHPLKEQLSEIQNIWTDSKGHMPPPFQASLTGLIASSTDISGHLAESLEFKTYSPTGFVSIKKSDSELYQEQLDESSNIDSELKEKSQSIESNPHWKVSIKPSRFVTHRIHPVKDCFEIVSDCGVSRKGHEYPVVIQKNKILSDLWVGSYSDSYCSSWKLFNSGMFVHSFQFREDDDFDDYYQKAINRIVTPEDFVPLGGMEVFLTLFKATMIYMFASCISTQLGQSEEYQVDISLIGVKNRILIMADRDRSWHNLYESKLDRINWNQTVNQGDLVTNHLAYAIDATWHFLERFGVDSLSPKLLEDQQRKFLSE